MKNKVGFWIILISLILELVAGVCNVKKIEKVSLTSNAMGEVIETSSPNTIPSTEPSSVPSVIPTTIPTVLPTELSTETPTATEKPVANPTASSDSTSSPKPIESPKPVVIDEAKGEEYISEDDLLYSNKYLVTENTIERIDPLVSIKEFVSNLKVAEGRTIKVYDGENEVTTGYIGTGMKVKGDNGREYLVSVRGDMTGDGKANQVELTKIIRHIVKQKGWELVGINYTSGDINGDGLVNLIDVGKMINYIVYGKWDHEKIENPN